MNKNRQFFLNKCMCVDFETSGLDFDEAEILEQGITFYDDEWKIIHKQLHNCKGEIPPESSAVSNIVSDMVANEPFFTADNFAAGCIDPEYNILVSHNAPFDSGIVEKYIDPDTYKLLKDSWLCTLRMVKKLYANTTEVTQFDLSYLRYRFKLPVQVDTEPHRAGYDSYLTGLLLDYILDEMEARELLFTEQEYFPQIIEWMNTPIQIELMPLGKYQGMAISEIPMSYLEWAVNNMDRLDEESPQYDSDLAVSIATVMDGKL
jgi:exodeoxyribonuclease X